MSGSDCTDLDHCECVIACMSVLSYSKSES
jgi:hypothetical protein